MTTMSPRSPNREHGSQRSAAGERRQDVHGRAGGQRRLPIMAGQPVDQETGGLQHQASRSPCRSRQHCDAARPATRPRRSRWPTPPAAARAPGEVADRSSTHDQPPIADIGRAGCRKDGSSMPCPARLPHIATRQAVGDLRRRAPARSSPRRSVSLGGEEAVADLAVGGEPGAVAVAAERPGHAADDADPGRVRPRRRRDPGPARSRPARFHVKPDRAAARTAPATPGSRRR